MVMISALLMTLVGQPAMLQPKAAGEVRSHCALNAGAAKLVKETTSHLISTPDVLATQAGCAVISVIISEDGRVIKAEMVYSEGEDNIKWLARARQLRFSRQDKSWGGLVKLVTQ